jgi:hypothetical protein
MLFNVWFLWYLEEIILLCFLDKNNIFLSFAIRISLTIKNLPCCFGGLSKKISWDRTSKGKSTLIFSCPVFFNTQGYGETNSTTLPDGVVAANRPRINADNNGHLFINT